jgi:hypothetical protein
VSQVANAPAILFVFFLRILKFFSCLTYPIAMQ